MTSALAPSVLNRIVIARLPRERRCHWKSSVDALGKQILVHRFKAHVDTPDKHFH